MKEAMFWEKSGKNVKCLLCPRNCIISEGKTGFCRVRKNVGGSLFSLNYGKAVSVAVDPIEKKPLFHFAPGSSCLSFATVGCNFRCLHCQNSEISQEFDEVYGQSYSPKGIVDLAKRQGAQGIAYTYVEPTIFFEYAYDTMKLAKKAGLYNVWVSNGYTSPGVIEKLKGLLDAVNVDLKGNEEFYKKVCMTNNGYESVKESIELYHKLGIFLEVTNLIIPGYNGSEKEIGQTVDFMANLDRNIPLHFSAFYPANRMTDVKPTPAKTLEKAYEIAKKAGLKYVYLGNVRSRHESTYCPKCGETVIERNGYVIGKVTDKCDCGEKVLLKGKEFIK